MNSVLEAGQLVDVVLDGGWRQTMRVSRVDGGSVEMMALEEHVSLPAALQWSPAVIEWRSGFGAARHEGMLFGHSHGLRLEPTGGPIVVQRRRFVRVRTEVAAALIAPDEQRLLTQTIDLSVGGMLLRNAGDLGVRDRVRFALDLGGATVSGEGEVVRDTPDGRRGISFGNLNPSSERMLSRFVAERQREKVRGA